MELIDTLTIEDICGKEVIKAYHESRITLYGEEGYKDSCRKCSLKQIFEAVNDYRNSKSWN